MSVFLEILVAASPKEKPLILGHVLLRYRPETTVQHAVRLSGHEHRQPL